MSFLRCLSNREVSFSMNVSRFRPVWHWVRFFSFSAKMLFCNTSASSVTWRPFGVPVFLLGHPLAPPWVSFGRRWLPLAAPGRPSPWLPLAALGRPWLPLVALGCSWAPLGPPGSPLAVLGRPWPPPPLLASGRPWPPLAAPGCRYCLAGYVCA